MIGIIYKGEEITKIMSNVNSEVVKMNCEQGEAFLMYPFDIEGSEHWIENGKVMPKTDFPFMPVDDNPTVQSGIRISQVPPRTTVVWPDFEITFEDDGLVECGVPYPGEYTFTFHNARYYPEEITINVQA